MQSDGFLKSNKKYVNLFILIAYLVYLFSSSLISGFISLNHENRTEDWVSDTFEYTWTEAEDGYILNYQTIITNHTDGLIDKVNVRFVILNEDEEAIAGFIDSYEDLEVGESRIVEGTHHFTEFGTSINQSTYVPFNTELSNSLQLIFALIIAVVLFFINKQSYKDDFVHFKNEPKKHFGYIFSGFILIYVAATIANIIMISLGVEETSMNEMAIQSMFSPHWISVITLFLSLVIITPIVEETVFRKGLYGIVRPGLGDVGAVLVSGLIFGFLHVAGWGDFIQVIPYAFMGLSFSFIYYYSGRNVYVVIAIHALNNLIPYLIYTTDLFS